MDQLIADGAPDLVLMDLNAEVSFQVLSDMKPAMRRSRIVLWVNSISTELAFQAMGLGVRASSRPVTDRSKTHEEAPATFVQQGSMATLIASALAVPVSISSRYNEALLSG
jgi:hypothetical protein